MKLGEQNRAKETVFANIENLKAELRDLNKKLKESDMKNQELQQIREFSIFATNSKVFLIL